MSSFRFDPPISATPGIVQTVTLTEDDAVVGTARWHAAADDTGGIVQLLDFEIAPAHRRRGHGKRLLAAVVDQSLAYHRANQKIFRRLWLTFHHKRHVLARALFLSQGFTHISTVKEIARGEDLLVYLRTFD